MIQCGHIVIELRPGGLPWGTESDERVRAKKYLVVLHIISTP